MRQIVLTATLSISLLGCLPTNQQSSTFSEDESVSQADAEAIEASTSETAPGSEHLNESLDADLTEHALDDQTRQQLIEFRDNVNENADKLLEFAATCSGKALTFANCKLKEGVDRELITREQAGKVWQKVYKPLHEVAGLSGFKKIAARAVVAAKMKEAIDSLLAADDRLRSSGRLR